MPPVDRGIDDDGLTAVRGDVAPPQIAMQSCWWLGRPKHLGSCAQSIELAVEAKPRALAQWPQSPLDIERRPVGLRGVVLLQRREKVIGVEAKARRTDAV